MPLVASGVVIITLILVVIIGELLFKVVKWMKGKKVV